MSALDPPSYHVLPDDEQKYAASASSSSSATDARRGESRYGRGVAQSPSKSSSRSRHRSRSPQKSDKDDEDDDDTRGILDSDDELMEERVTLVSQGNEEFSLPRRFCDLSEYLKNLLEGDHEAATIQLAKLTPSQTRKIVAYLTHWGGKKENEEPVNLEPPIESSDLVDIAGAWCANFVDISQAELFELFLASNYLGIRPLVSLCAAKIACDMHEKSPSEIQKMYNIRDDFTEDEELEVRRKYREFIE